MGDDGLDAAVGAIALVDHHVHPALATELSHGELEELITESDRPVPPGTTRFDSQLGIAIRRWCCPVLGLPASAPAQAYVDRRRELGAARVTRRLLRAAGVSQLLIDTGYLRDGMLGLAAMAEAAAAGVAEVVRLESVAEQAIVAGDGSATGFAERFRAALWERTTAACGVKSIAAYRFGLDLDPRAPAAAEVASAAGGWRRQIDAGGIVRVTDPVLLRFLLWAGVDRGLPVQIHTGFGDPDVDLSRSDPLLLRGFCELTQERAVPLMLLHCYPLPPAGRISRPRLPARLHRRRPGHQPCGRPCPRGRGGIARAGAVRQGPVLLRRLGPARASLPRCPAVAAGHRPGARRVGGIG